MFWLVIISGGLLGLAIVGLLYVVIAGLFEGYKQTHNEGWEDPFR